MANINLVEEIPETLQQVTEFQDATLVVREEPQHTLSGVETQVYDLASISAFLSRPYPVWYGSWKNTDAIGNFLGILDFPQELLKIPSVWAKVNNFRYIRADLRISIRINGTKMHYGKLAFCWLPYLEADQMVGFNNTMTGLLTYPHIIISPNEDNVVEMVIPYSAPETYMQLELFTLNDPKIVFPRFGTLIVMVLNPLYAGAADNDVSYTVYANFENIVLDGMGGYLTGSVYRQTYPNVLYNRAAGGQITFKKLETIVSDITYSDTVAPLVAQGRTQIDGEAEAKSAKGVISGPLEAFSNAGKCLTKVPLIGPYASLFSTTTSVMARIAKSMGWCKPNTVAADTNVLNKNFNFSYGRGLDSAQKLSVLPDNHIVSAKSHMGSHDDEMNFQFLLSTPQLLAIETITSDMPIGTIIGTNVNNYGVPISPMVCGSDYAAVTPPFRQVYQTLLRHVASSAMYWRGSLRYCVQFTASAFHSGRIRIMYLPFYADLPRGATFVDRCNLVNMVVDLQRETEVTFTVPFLYHYPWCSQRENIGTLYFDVMNPITHSESPVPPVYMNVWVSAGPDFQLAWPTSIPCVLTNSSNARSAIADISIDTLSIEEKAEDCGVAQGKTREDTREAAYPPIIPAHGFLDTGMAMGEVINTVKHFTNRPSACFTVKYLSLANQAYYASAFAVLPHYDSLFYKNVTYPGNFLQWFRFLYVFSRGSVNYKVDIARDQTTAEIKTSLMVYGKNFAVKRSRVGYQGNTDSLATVGYQLMGSGDGMVNVNLPTSVMLEACVPFYNTTFCVHNLVDTFLLPGEPTRVISTYSDIPIPCFRWFTNAGAGARVETRLYSSSGDDFEFGYIRGAPILRRFGIA